MGNHATAEWSRDRQGFFSKSEIAQKISGSESDCQTVILTWRQAVSSLKDRRRKTLCNSRGHAAETLQSGHDVHAYWNRIGESTESTESTPTGKAATRPHRIQKGGHRDIPFYGHPY